MSIISYALLKKGFIKTEKDLVRLYILIIIICSFTGAILTAYALNIDRIPVNDSGMFTRTSVQLQGYADAQKYDEKK